MVLMANETGIYTKGDSTKVASTSADAVALVFDGYSRAGDVPPESDEVDEVDDEQPAGEPVDAPVQIGQTRSFSSNS